ncbi:class I SAM-dependent methyltransferase [Leptospira kanakyensis]|uniref:Class I SAM-dependent methyltransferase n=1 Tax=Leptospira kanakyensis TaxID=2484968 RepID=A0A6N4Q771_9LEPT|nr:cyclopropane-fatty-acyl-phospholipid synthase family protein [Leptospira kanakyensis]TGK54510.1 class I SAM-dependent methyltransferase [Leptospira kanakyensis]TGK59022.1 class I SAM-dependent methyltransferase [Leptospira kanakyensis]TGK75173.1 class I SAM-dependent methyltransferase [Leptospira kanakyensis]
MEKSQNQSLLQDTIDSKLFTELKNKSTLEQFPIYRKIFLKAMSSMKRGSLRMILPDGDQITLGDPNATVDPKFHSALIHVKDPVFFKKSVLYGDIGFSESYLTGDWETDSIENVISWFILNVDESPSLSGAKKKLFHLDLFNLGNKFLHFLRKNTLTGSKKNIIEHYDLGNKFYKLFLDPSMTYSSAYFESLEDSLEEAQTRKVDKLCQKLKLNSGDHLLEIGSGWGFLSIHAAKNYGCRVTTVTLSEEQYVYAKERIAKEGLSDKIEIRIQDYRKIEGQFTKIVSVEMLEAVGDAFYETFFQKCQDLLTKDGIMALQVITCPDSRFTSFKNGIDFIQKHIFPGSLLPSIGRMNQAINRTGDMYLFHLEDMGMSYAKTLRLWLKAFEENLTEVRNQGYSETFIRKWRYYLAYCAAAFQMRNISVIQSVYVRPNNLVL